MWITLWGGTWVDEQAVTVASLAYVSRPMMYMFNVSDDMATVELTEMNNHVSIPLWNIFMSLEKKNIYCWFKIALNHHRKTDSQVFLANDITSTGTCCCCPPNMKQRWLWRHGLPRGAYDAIPVNRLRRSTHLSVFLLPSCSRGIRGQTNLMGAKHSKRYREREDGGRRI